MEVDDGRGRVLLLGEWEDVAVAVAETLVVLNPEEEAGELGVFVLSLTEGSYEESVEASTPIMTVIRRKKKGTDQCA